MRKNRNRKRGEERKIQYIERENKESRERPGKAKGPMRGMGWGGDKRRRDRKKEIDMG